MRKGYWNERRARCSLDVLGQVAGGYVRVCLWSRAGVAKGVDKNDRTWPCVGRVAVYAAENTTDAGTRCPARIALHRHTTEA